MHLRKEYRDYCNDCMDANEVPWPFRDWYWVSYEYIVYLIN